MENSTSMPGSTPNSSGNVKPASDGLQRGVDAAGSAMHNTIDKAADPARKTVDRVSTAAHETVDKLASGAADVADRFSDQARWVSEAPGRALDTSKSWIQDKPLEAVGVALALGFVIGRLTAN